MMFCRSIKIFGLTLFELMGALPYMWSIIFFYVLTWLKNCQIFTKSGPVNGYVRNVIKTN